MLRRAGYAAGGHVAAEATDEQYQQRGMDDIERNNYKTMRGKTFENNERIPKDETRFHATNPPGRLTPDQPDPWADTPDTAKKRGGRTRKRRADGGSTGDDGKYSVDITDMGGPVKSSERMNAEGIPYADQSKGHLGMRSNSFGESVHNSVQGVKDAGSAALKGDFKGAGDALETARKRNMTRDIWTNRRRGGPACLADGGPTPADGRSPQQQLGDAVKGRDQLDQSDEDGRRMEIVPGRAKSADPMTRGVPRPGRNVRST